MADLRQGVGIKETPKPKTKLKESHSPTPPLPRTLNKSSSYEGSTKGVLVYSLQDLFAEFMKFRHNTFIVRCAYFEIYNDLCYDLLANFEEFGDSLPVCEDPKKGDFFVKGLKEVIVNNYEECMEILKIGEFNRHYAATSMNHQSS